MICGGCLGTAPIFFGSVGVDMQRDASPHSTNSDKECDSPHRTTGMVSRILSLAGAGNSLLRRVDYIPCLWAVLACANLMLCGCTWMGSLERANRSVERKQAAVTSHESERQEAIRSRVAGVVDSLAPVDAQTNNPAWGNLHVGYELARQAQDLAGTPRQRIDVESLIVGMISSNAVERARAERTIGELRSDNTALLTKLSNSNADLDTAKKQLNETQGILAKVGAEYRDFKARVAFWFWTLLIVGVIGVLGYVALRVWLSFDPAAQIGGVSVSLAGQVAKRAVAQITKGGEWFKNALAGDATITDAVKDRVFELFRSNQMAAQDSNVQAEIKRLTATTTNT